jgi:hypothetical protein
VEKKPTSSPSIKILGHGKVVKGFLAEYPTNALAVQVYAKTAALGLYPLSELCMSSEDVLIYCCSIDEKKYLQSLHVKPDRLAVARPNMALVNWFIERSYFQSGTIFVLSNPSEILAEQIRLQTGNQAVYALGLSYDLVRYRRIIREIGLQSFANGHVQIGGNHYQNAHVLDGLPLHPSWHGRLATAFSEALEREFDGFQPPIKSGIEAIRHVVLAKQMKSHVCLSGYSSVLDCFTGGKYDFGRLSFHPHLGTSRFIQERIIKIAEIHREIRKNYLPSSEPVAFPKENGKR